jgi:hypothetical protein
MIVAPGLVMSMTEEHRNVGKKAVVIVLFVFGAVAADSADYFL